MQQWFNVLNKSNNAKLFFLAGQSNSLGTAAITSGDAPGYFGTYSNVGGLGFNVYIWSVANQQWEILEYQTNQQSADSDSFGQEMELGYRAVFEFRTDIYIVKYAESGTGLYQEATERDWNPNSTSELYDELITETNTALGDLSIAYDPTLFFWMQGERDASFEVRANAYNTNLRLFINSFRSDIFNINFAAGRLNSSFYTYESTVRAAFDDVCGKDSVNRIENTYLMDLDDLVKFGDNIHYTGVSQNIIANRMLKIKDIPI